LKIARHLLERMQKTDLYKRNALELDEADEESSFSLLGAAKKRKNQETLSSPRRKRRERALREAKDIENARQRQMVVGRPSWPMDRSDGPPRHQQEA
jgi:hypothetical protein